MTTYNIKMTLMFSLIAMIGVPAFALADMPPQANTTIMLDNIPADANPILVKLNELEDQKQTAKNQKAIDALQAQQDRLIAEDRKNYSVVSSALVKRNNVLAEKLADHIINKRGAFVDGKENFIPFTEIGYYPNEKAIMIGIQQDFVTDANMQKYADIARDVIGPKIDIIVYNDGEYGSVDSCSSATSNCTPMEGGIQINIAGNGGCTLGFPATKGGNEGFVTAGHCGDGDVGEDVDQATTRKVGELVKETFDDGSSGEYCDCAFVKLTEGIDLDYKIFGISSSYYPDHKGQAGTNDYIKMIGKSSGIEIGQVKATSVTVTLDGTTFKHVVKADYDRDGGDSGGIVMEAYSSDPAYLGSHTGYKSGYTYYVKYYKFESHIGGLTWGF